MENHSNCNYENNSTIEKHHSKISVIVEVITAIIGNQINDWKNSMKKTLN